jgi:hypothetical protein
MAKKMGRHTIDTPELREALAANLKLGLTRNDACILAHVSKTSFYNWLEKNEDFLNFVEEAELECKKRNVSLIQKHAIKNAGAAQWWLERKHKDEYSNLQRHDLTTNGKDLPTPILAHVLNNNGDQKGDGNA